MKQEQIDMINTRIRYNKAKALYERAGSPGEQEAAKRAMQRLASALKPVAEAQPAPTPTEIVQRELADAVQRRNHRQAQKLRAQLHVMRSSVPIRAADGIPPTPIYGHGKSVRK